VGLELLMGPATDRSSGAGCRPREHTSPAAEAQSLKAAGREPRSRPTARGRRYAAR